MQLKQIELFYIENLFIYIVCCISLCLILLLLYSVLDLCYTTKEITSSSSYECGFLPYGEANVDIDLNFGAIAVLFIVFDLETVMLLPFITDHSLLNLQGYICIFIFLITFIVGLYYEIKSQVITI
jgi:NADH-quinone oxidoreductase subunit A